MTLEKALEIVTLLVQGDNTLDPNDVRQALQLCLNALTFLEHLFRVIKQMEPMEDSQPIP